LKQCISENLQLAVVGITRNNIQENNGHKVTTSNPSVAFGTFQLLPEWFSPKPLSAPFCLW
jgi:hypothetical protein